MRACPYSRELRAPNVPPTNGKKLQQLQQRVNFVLKKMKSFHVGDNEGKEKTADTHPQAQV